MVDLLSSCVVVVLGVAVVVVSKSKSNPRSMPNSFSNESKAELAF
jgi:hypothetical protein